MGNTQRVAQTRDHFRLVPAFGAKPMVDRRHFNEPGADRGCKQQQRQTVRTAGDGDPNPRARFNERAQILREAFDRCLLNFDWFSARQGLLLSTCSGGVRPMPVARSTWMRGCSVMNTSAFAQLHCACVLAPASSFLRSGRILAP